MTPDPGAARGPLDGKVAIVTGGASGIGRAVVTRLVSDGAHVAAGDIDADGLDALAADTGCAVLRADATDPTDQEALVELALERYGRLDVAVANAGAGHAAGLLDHTLEDWQRIIDLCLTGVYLTVQAAARRIADHGSIITIASLNGVQAARGMAAYCAAKAGVIALTEVAALELGHRGVRANAVAPGLVRTAATEAIWLLPELVADYEENTAVGRHAEPEEIAGVVAFLAGDEASFISGSTQLVDGGAHLNRYPNVFRALGLGPDGRSPSDPASGGAVDREGAS